MSKFPILIWSSNFADLAIAMLGGKYAVFYHGEQVALYGTFEYAKKLAEDEFVLNNEQVFYSDPAAGFDSEQLP